MAITTNTNKHISDKANSVTIDKTNTIWKDNSNINTVQDALESLQPITIKEVHATDENYGLVRLAKDIDLENLRGTNDVVTSKQMFEYNGKPQANYTTYGTTRYATQQETVSGTSEVVSINAKQLQYKFDNTNSTRTRFGTIKLADESMVVPGTNDNTVMTPKLVKLAIDRLVPVPEVIIADEQLNGTVTLANVAVTQQGTIRKGYAVSPHAFKNTNATTTIYGTVRSATVAEVRAGAISDKAVVTPKTFIDARATTTQVGTTQLATVAESQSATISNKAVTPAGLKYLKDSDVSINKRIDDLRKQLLELINADDTVYGTVPIGGVIDSFTLPNINTGFVLADGRSLSRTTYPEAFSVFGYKYGGSGDSFNIPDMRGLYTRMYSKGKYITGNLSDGVTGGNVGDVQRQQTRKHKHVGSWGVDRQDNAFGYTNNWWHAGSGRHDYNNPRYFTNDGMPWDGNPNPDGSIGYETRPWTMSVYKLIRIK